MTAFLFNSRLVYPNTIKNRKQTIVIKNLDNFCCSMDTTHGSSDSSKTFSGTNGTSIYITDGQTKDKWSYNLKGDEKTTKNNDDFQTCGCMNDIETFVLSQKKNIMRAALLVLLVAYFIYFGFAMKYEFGNNESSWRLFICTIFGVFLLCCKFARKFECTERILHAPTWTKSQRFLKMRMAFRWYVLKYSKTFQKYLY